MHRAFHAYFVPFATSKVRVCLRKYVTAEKASERLPFPLLIFVWDATMIICR